MSDPANYPVLVHCFAGIHRTGAYCAIYRMEFDHWTNDRAIDELKAHGYYNLPEEKDILGYLRTTGRRGRIQTTGEWLTSPSSRLLVPTLRIEIFMPDAPRPVPSAASTGRGASGRGFPRGAWNQAHSAPRGTNSPPIEERGRLPRGGLILCGSVSRRSR